MSQYVGEIGVQCVLGKVIGMSVSLVVVVVGGLGMLNLDSGSTVVVFCCLFVSLVVFVEVPSVGLAALGTGCSWRCAVPGSCCIWGDGMVLWQGTLRRCGCYHISHSGLPGYTFSLYVQMSGSGGTG